MNVRDLSIPELILIVGTRVALGIGVGLLISNRLDRSQRNAAGLSLALVGGLSTIPIAMNLFNKSDKSRELHEAA